VFTDAVPGAAAVAPKVLAAAALEAMPFGPVVPVAAGPNEDAVQEQVLSALEAVWEAAPTVPAPRSVAAAASQAASAAVVPRSGGLPQ